MNYLGKGNNELFGIEHLVKVGNDALCNLFWHTCTVGHNAFYPAVLLVGNVIEGRNIYAAYLCSPFKEALLCVFAGLFHLLVKLHQFKVGFLALADNKQVDKITQGFGIAYAGAARNYNGVIFTALSRRHRQTCQVKHIQDICIAKLVLNSKADEIELLYGVKALQTVKRNVIFTHERLVIGPRRKNTLAPPVLTGIFQGVEYFHADVGHSHIVCVGEAESKAHIHLAFILYNAVELSADVS